MYLALTGAPNERASAQDLAQDLDPSRVVNLAGETDLPGLMALYERASLLITNDSGPAHFACLADLPVVVLFGPETPAIYQPPGRQGGGDLSGFGLQPLRVGV